MSLSIGKKTQTQPSWAVSTKSHPRPASIRPPGSRPFEGNPDEGDVGDPCTEFASRFLSIRGSAAISPPESPPAPLRVAVVADDDGRAAIFVKGLAGLADIRLVASEGDLVRRLCDLAPDAVMIDAAGLTQMRISGMLEVARAVARPVAMFVEESSAADTRAAVEAGVAAYVVAGLSKERVKPILDTAIGRHAELTRLKAELAAAKAELSERKLIDRAKGVLMHLHGIGEAEAYARLRQRAMNEQRRIGEVSQSVIDAAAILEK